ncbi:MAG: lipopolysaccharide biosynthesis protein [Flavobacteriales bacterium]
MNEPRTTAFRRNIITLLGGTALAQAIPLLAAPVLARIYTPEQFGALALLLAIANPVSLVVCGRYELTVVLPRDDAKANLLARSGLFLAVSVTLLLAGLMGVFHAPLASVLGGSNATWPLLLAPILFGLMGFFQPLNNWLIRKQAFRAMGVNKMAQTTGITAVTLVLGWLSVEMGLLWGYIAGWAVYVLVAMAQVRKTGFRYRPWDLAAMRAASLEHRDFPLYNTLPALLHTATLSIPVFLIVRQFGEDTTGQLNLCRQTVLLPVTFFATTWMQVYMQRASRTVIEREQVLPGLWRSMLTLAVMAAALVVTLVLGGPFLFAWVFGTEWTLAGEFARLLAVPIALQFVVTPLTVILPPMGHIKGLSIWQAVYFALVLSYSLVPASDVWTYLQGLAIVESLALLALLVYILRMAQRHDHDLRADAAAPAP